MSYGSETNTHWAPYIETDAIPSIAIRNVGFSIKPVCDIQKQLCDLRFATNIIVSITEVASNQ